ncbi:MAG: alpha/beta hydrolase [Phycisphaerae bacterium]|nr:alpha/beta hydrolase [Gemmatimonadaceae bacterium]
MVAYLLVGSSLSGQAATPPADVVPAHDTFTVLSKAVGEPRRINVYTPPSYKLPAAGRFPVLYMPDGGLDEDFPHVVNTVDSLIALKKIRPVIVVGIPNTERRRDLTGPTRIASDSAIAKRVGGSAQFRTFMRDELFPAVNARYRTTEERSVVGESLAGLFVVETFLLDPTLFTHYIAVDASLWWNKGALIDAAPAHLKSFGSAARSIHFSSSSEDIDARNTTFAAVLNAHAPKQLLWTFTPRADLKHATIFRGEGPAALLQALR